MVLFVKISFHKKSTTAFLRGVTFHILYWISQITPYKYEKQQKRGDEPKGRDRVEDSKMANFGHFWVLETGFSAWFGQAAPTREPPERAKAALAALLLKGRSRPKKTAEKRWKEKREEILLWKRSGSSITCAKIANFGYFWDR